MRNGLVNQSFAHCTTAARACHRPFRMEKPGPRVRAVPAIIPNLRLRLNFFFVVVDVQ